MARLNEPITSVETIDALKRRFVRQNREIARVNSTQSLRIRSLESEITRLLSENIVLRERVISLQYEVDKRPGRSALEEMGTVKERLEAKLTELGDLVHEFGRIQVAAVKPRSPKRKSLNQIEPKRSPDQKNWKNHLTLSEVTGGGDGRLPPIVEDKYFPRKTLDAEELLGIFPDQANVTDSPDLGPPPVAHFEEGDPVKFDPSRGSAPPADAKGGPGQHPLFANLETRRKRRESTSMAQTRLPEQTDARTAQSDASSSADLGARPLGQPLRSSAKRKFNPTEEENKTREVLEKSGQDEDFLLDRSRQILADSNKNGPAKSTVPKKGEGLLLYSTAPREFTTDQATLDKKVKEDVIAETTNNRKALGPKSVNTDPTSPAKLGRFGSIDKVNESKDEVVKRLPSRNRLKDKASKPITASKESIPINAPRIAAKAASEMPTSLSHDLFSTVSSEPSTAHSHSRDTPPPSDLQPGASNAGAFGTADRATRRPRGGVSYAEPNLRDKMRRPTKDLVDAVGADDRPQHLATSKLEEKLALSDSAPRKSAHAPHVKEESDANASELWQIPSSTPVQEQHQRDVVAPASPLGNKSSIPATELPTSVITNRRRRTVGLHRIEAEGSELSSHQNHPGAGSAILALTAGSQRARRRDEEKTAREEQVERQGTEKDPSGRLLPDGLENVDGKQTQESAMGSATTSSRNTRRYSSMAGDAAPATTAMAGGKGGIGGGPVARKRERKKEPISRARGDNNDSASELKSIRSVAGLNHEGELVAGGDEVTGRAERAAMRRRSMML